MKDDTTLEYGDQAILQEAWIQHLQQPQGQPVSPREIDFLITDAMGGRPSMRSTS